MTVDTVVIDEAMLALPAPALRPYVAWYSGYRQQGLAPAVHRGLPSPYLTFILTLDDPLVIAAHPDPAQARGSYTALLGGLHTSPALITHSGRQSGIQIAVRPLAARTLFGLPAGELGGQDLPLDTVLGPLGELLRERLRTVDGWAERFAALDDALLTLAGAAADRPQPQPEVHWAWQALLRTGGALPVADLVRETGWSSRHLQERFRRETGLTPKAAARVIRFDRARRMLGAASGPWRLADLAAHCGYFDQAHLAREFRSLAGCAPSTWLESEGLELAKFRNVQGSGDPVAPEYEA
ncbi:helix-turn-helix domain-containing protein [Kitasatospora sp. NPDC002040]|uniref:AraC family transcriptional regulator n=1 Tax=Kitasatospora sp. NPDC002040 TaxID=3154661 RepID=UPI00331792BF